MKKLSFWGVVAQAMKEQLVRNKDAKEMSTIERLNSTYGASFLLLLLLGYFTQGLRCFPWVAMSYWYKDTLKV